MPTDGWSNIQDLCVVGAMTSTYDKLRCGVCMLVGPCECVQLGEMSTCLSLGDTDCWLTVRYLPTYIEERFVYVHLPTCQLPTSWSSDISYGHNGATSHLGVASSADILGLLMSRTSPQRRNA